MLNDDVIIIPLPVDESLLTHNLIYNGVSIRDQKIRLADRISPEDYIKWLTDQPVEKWLQSIRDEFQTLIPFDQPLYICVNWLQAKTFKKPEKPSLNKTGELRMYEECRLVKRGKSTERISGGLSRNAKENVPVFQQDLFYRPYVPLKTPDFDWTTEDGVDIKVTKIEMVEGTKLIPNHQWSQCIIQSADRKTTYFSDTKEKSQTTIPEKKKEKHTTRTGFEDFQAIMRDGGLSDLEKVSKQVLEVDFPEDSDELTAFFRGAANEASAIFSGKTTLSKEAILGATVGSFVAPVLGSMIGGAIGAWFGNERQQQEINTIIEKYEKSRTKIFVEWESLLEVVYNQIAKLINEVSSIELITYEAIDQAIDLCNEGNEWLNSEEGFLKAIEFYDRAISLNPRLAIAWNNKGYVLNQLERYEEALIVLERAIQINPSFVGSYNNYGDAFYGLDKYSEAMDAYDKCIKIDPDNHQSWWNKGFTFLNLEQPELALQSFDKCIEINDQNPNLWLIFCMKAVGYIQLEDFDKSIDSLAESIRINPSKAKEYIIQTEEFNCIAEDTRFQKIISTDSINCPSCNYVNAISNLTDNINCTKCGCTINVAARLDEVSFATNNLQTFVKVQDIVASQLGVDKTEIDPETSFVNDLGADELDILELMMALEEEFGIEIPDEDVEKITTVQDAVDYIESKQ